MEVKRKMQFIPVTGWGVGQANFRENAPSELSL